MNQNYNSLNPLLPAIALVSIVFSCGERSSVTEPDSPPSAVVQPTKIFSTSDKDKLQQTPQKSVTITSIGTLESKLHGAKSDVATCNLIHFGNGIFLAPEHCVKGHDVLTGHWDNRSRSLTLKVIERIQPKSTEVDALVILRSELENSHSAREKVDLDSAYVKDTLDYPADVLIVSRQADGKTVESPCFPLRYNADGLIAYDCDTTGGMSGALLILKSTRAPIGIHLGRKSGVGYGAAFNAISGITRGFVEAKPQFRSSHP